MFFPSELFTLNNLKIMYSIVVFPKENVCEGVPTSWIKCVGKEYFCCWPVKGDVRKFIKKAVDPSSFTWSLSKCLVKSTAVDFLSMIQKRKESEVMTTENQSSDSDSCDMSTATIKIAASLPLSDSEEERIDNYPTPPRKMILNTCE